MASLATIFCRASHSISKYIIYNTQLKMEYLNPDLWHSKSLSAIARALDRLLVCSLARLASPSTHPSVILFVCLDKVRNHDSMRICILKCNFSSS